MDNEKIENLKANFERDGFVYIPAFFNNLQMQEINNELILFIKNIVPTLPEKLVVYEDKNDPSTLKQLQDLQVHSSFFNQLMTNSEIEKIAAALLGEKVIGKNVEYFNKPARIGKATPPHQDAFYFNLKPPQAATMWIALEDADHNNGCVSYVKGSHLKGLRPHGRTQTIGFSQSITDYGTADDENNLVSFPAKPGDLLVHHSMTIHTAAANTTESRSRKALGLIYFGESAQQDSAAKEAYMKALQTQTL